MSFDEIAFAIISADKGFDKQSKTNWNSPEIALERVFREYDWAKFHAAIVIAGVRKYVVDPNDGFIPLAPGSIDVEAALEFNPKHRELQPYGRVTHRIHFQGLSEMIQRELDKRIGFATEYGNGEDSLEVVIPLHTPGVWEKIEDTQFDRPTGMVIVTPHITLWCEDMSINNLIDMPTKMMSVKMLEAIKIARHLCNICDIG